MQHCEYCMENSDGYVAVLDKNGHAMITKSYPDKKSVLWIRAFRKQWEVPINYCPICGRKLEEGSRRCRTMTNGDIIRQMADEELAIQLEAFICNKVEECRREDISCIDCALKWLKQEVSEDAGSKTD